VEVTSLTYNPVLLLNRWKNDVSTTLLLFWALLRLPKSSISDSAQNDNFLLALDGGEVIGWIDFPLLWNWEGERVAGVAEKEREEGVAAAKAASMEAISSSLTSSIWMPRSPLLVAVVVLMDNLESDSCIFRYTSLSVPKVSGFQTFCPLHRGVVVLLL
jgi:hypothetical protein